MMIDLFRFLDYNLQGKIQTFLLFWNNPDVNYRAFCYLKVPTAMPVNNANLRDCIGRDHGSPGEILLVFVVDLKEASKCEISN